MIINGGKPRSQYTGVCSFPNVKITASWNNMWRNGSFYSRYRTPNPLLEELKINI